MPWPIPHLPSSVRQWWGDARGRWEGDTLVVETTNFKDRAPAPNIQGSSEALKIVERFTRVSANTMRYPRRGEHALASLRAPSRLA